MVFMLYINTALVIIGLIAALTTFSGQTWNPEKPDLFRKITRLGWVSLSLIAITFILGIYKQIIDSQLVDEQNFKLETAQNSIKIQEINLNSAHDKIESQRAEIESRKKELEKARQDFETKLQKSEASAIKKSFCGNAKEVFIQNSLGYATSIIIQAREQFETASSMDVYSPEDFEKRRRVISKAAQNLDTGFKSYPERYQKCLENITNLVDEDGERLQVPSLEAIKRECAADLDDDNFIECKAKP
jgi:hypothetical protein